MPSEPHQHDSSQSSNDGALVAPQDSWHHHYQWRVLQIGDDNGQRFLRTWSAWQDDPQRPHLLHFIGCMPERLQPDQISAATPVALHPFAAALIEQCWGLLPGVHRLAFAHGRVLLTLYVGDPQSMLRQQTPQADRVYLPGLPDAGADAHLLKAIARCCRRGTTLRTASSFPELTALLKQCGFELPDAIAPLDTPLTAQFNPRWEPRPVREALPDASVPCPGSCMVIGAGLAGSACAASLARRGWRVTVLDARTPAAGASGLPAGVFAPHVSPDDSVLSRLSRAGVRTTLQTLADMQRGVQWDHTGVLEHRVDGTPGIPAAWSAEGNPGADWSRRATAGQCTANAVSADAMACWHVRAGWVKPPDLIEHHLAHEHIEVQVDAPVATLERVGVDTPAPRWRALDAHGNVLAQADVVVIAAGYDSRPLLPDDWYLQALRGQISWGLHAEAPPEAQWPRVPLNGNGNLVPHVPLAEGSGWVLGSTFERDVTALPPSASDVAAAHADNLDKLRVLGPLLAPQLADRFDQAIEHITQANAASAGNGTGVRNWGAVRVASHDRLPIVGPVDAKQLPGLWACTAMGSRGLTLSVLCGELLASRLHHEPLGMDMRLAQALSSERL